MSCYFANGEEGRAWSALWCDRCANDHGPHVGDYDQGCPLILDSLIDEGPVEGWHDDRDRFGHTFPPAVRCDKFVACGPCGETVTLDADGYPSPTQQREYIMLPDGTDRLMTHRTLTGPRDKEA